MGNIGAATSEKGFDVKNCADRLKVFTSAFQTLKVNQTYSVMGIIPKNTSADFTADAGTNVLTSVGHGLVNGDQVNFDTDGTLPGGLLLYTTDTIYYVIQKTNNTFKVSLTEGGSEVNITSAGSGTHTWYTDTVKIIIDHNIGYFCPAFMIYNGSTTLGQGSSYLNADADGQQSSFSMRNYTDRLELFIYYFFDGALSNPGDTIYFTFYFFLDDFSTIEEGTINSVTTASDEANDHGLRVSKEGFDVKSGADVNMILSSSFYNNIVHKKGIEFGDPASIVITHNLDYVPSAFIWERLSSVNYISQAPFSINEDNLIPEGFGGGNYYIYYIIFKSKLDG